MELDVEENVMNLLPPADWAGEIERLEESIRSERDRNMRTLADFKNYRRRIERDGNKLSQEGKREMMLPLLEIIDDIEKALQWANDQNQSSLKGLTMIRQKFPGLLETNGVVPFESIGTPFNHTRHEAVSMAKNDEAEPGTIVDELRRGYLWNNEVFRTAQVRVAG